MTTDRIVTGSEIELQIGGMTCASCAARIEKKLNRVEGVTANVNYATEKAHVVFTDTVSVEDLIDVVEQTGYSAELPAPPAGTAPGDAEPPDPTREPRIRLLVSAALSVPIIAMAMVPA